jgi:hypothetical protein
VLSGHHRPAAEVAPGRTTGGALKSSARGAQAAVHPVMTCGAEGQIVGWIDGVPGIALCVEAQIRLRCCRVQSGLEMMC